MVEINRSETTDGGCHFADDRGSDIRLSGAVLGNVVCEAVEAAVRVVVKSR